ncbi:MAG: efflux RND transporter periplasmic adaptor subunit [Clostridium sp.]|nr:efflux RND transporter periplasmic adaptor subunit [Clostridium sp.]
MSTNKILIILTITLLAVCSCSKQNGNTPGATTEPEMTENYVDTIRLKRSEFRHQIVSNGKLRPKLKSELSTKHSDPLTRIEVSTGERVRKGQLLAVTDEEPYRRALEKARSDYEKAEIDFEDKLISLGFEGSAEMPDDIRRRAEIISGLFAARHALDAAEKDLADCSIYSPIDGRIADLEGKLYQKSSLLCSIVDESEFDVDFSILEAELPNVAVGYEARVIPFAAVGEELKGKITAINPRVSDKGLVNVTARVPGGRNLLDGMNVRVIVERVEPAMFVVPKDAVVERDGYYVVFIYRDGQAVWRYVDILSSNLTQHAITGSSRKNTTVDEGEIIITSGNMNLSDGTKVKPRGESDL